MTWMRKGWHDGGVVVSMVRKERHDVRGKTVGGVLMFLSRRVASQVLLTRYRYDGLGTQRQALQTISEAIHHLEAKTV